MVFHYSSPNCLRHHFYSYHLSWSPTIGLHNCGDFYPHLLQCLLSTASGGSHTTLQNMPLLCLTRVKVPSKFFHWAPNLWMLTCQPPLHPISPALYLLLAHSVLSPCSLQFLKRASRCSFQVQIPFPGRKHGWSFISSRSNLRRGRSLLSSRSILKPPPWCVSFQARPCLSLLLPHRSDPPPNHPLLLISFPQHLAPSDIAYVLLILLFTACLPRV